MSHLIRFLNSLSPLDPEAADELLRHTVTRSFARGELILPPGKVCSQLYFLETGLVKLCFQKDGKEFIMRFFAEHSLCTGLDSYLTRAPSDYALLALEPTTVTCVAHADMERLCQMHHSIETAFRKFVSVAALNMMKRVSEMLEEDGTARYSNFVTANGALLQRISLGDLAAYLGMTQVSLSRIRAKK